MSAILCFLNHPVFLYFEVALSVFETQNEPKKYKSCFEIKAVNERTKHMSDSLQMYVTRCIFLLNFTAALFRV